jgi:hypothetical protein
MQVAPRQHRPGQLETKRLSQPALTPRGGVVQAVSSSNKDDCLRRGQAGNFVGSRKPLVGEFFSSQMGGHQWLWGLRGIWTPKSLKSGNQEIVDNVGHGSLVLQIS